MDRQTEQFVRDFLNGQYLTYSGADDCWCGEVNLDSCDELSDKQLIQVSQAKHPESELYGILDEAYDDAKFEYIPELLSEIERKWDSEIADWEDVCNDIDEFLIDHVYFDIPVEHFFDQEVYVNIILNTGDLNYDYVLNCVYPHYNGTCGEHIDDHAAIVALTRWQGYTKTALKKALFDSEDAGSKFLGSLRTEIENCTTHMNAVTFLVSMTLGELIELNGRIAAVQSAGAKDGRYFPWKIKSKDSVFIPAGTTCGLYDPWNGAGGSFEIEIERGFNLPLKYIDTAWPDGGRGYSVAEIYGVTRLWWRNEIEMKGKKIA